MNIQTERLENHTARFKVEVEPNIWEQAKKKAARELSKRYRIPGFRKGKAPYNIVVRHLGEQPIIEDAMEKLGNEVYKDTLEKSELAPYAPGTIEDFQLEPQPTYIFTVPLQPEVKLSDYREIRLDFEAPEVVEEDVERAMRDLQQKEAGVENSELPIQVGDRVTVDIHSEFVDDPDADEEDQENSEESEQDNKNTPPKGAQFIHEHDAEINLDPENEPILPGLIDALVGANAEEDVEFELTVPNDKKGYENIAGRKVQFNMTVKKVQNVTLPELNDDFAAVLTADEDEPISLSDLRVRVREGLQKEAEQKAESDYGNRILDLIVEQAEINYHDSMIDDRIHDMILDFDRMLRQQGLTLETYQQVTGVTQEQLYEQHHDEAVESLERTLVLGEVLIQENVKITRADIDAEIDTVLSQFGEQAALFRSYFDTEDQRQNIANNLLYQRIMNRLVKIAKGESLEEEATDELVVDAVIDDTETLVEDSSEENGVDEVVEETEATAETDDAQIETDD